jgi:uncharacterized protein (DUF433 family)
MYTRNMVSAETLLERITLNPAVMVGKPTIRGFRITVEQILLALAAGVSQADLLADYPELEPDDIRAVLLYAGQLVADERVIALAK